MDVICVLPARLSSTRISKKPLQKIAGRSLLEWCWRAACRVRAFDRILIGTDSAQIETEARGFEAEVVMTASEHRSGTDRVDEVARKVGAAEDDVVVNFQADEPFVDPGAVDRAVRVLVDHNGAADDPAPPEIATLAAPIRNVEEWRSKGVVKVARAVDGRALYFSRSPIPFVRDGAPRFGPAGSTPFLRHIGIYVCRRSALQTWAGLPESVLEGVEQLEQLRALEAGMRIHVEVGSWTEPGIDLPADIRRAEALLSTG